MSERETLAEKHVRRLRAEIAEHGCPRELPDFEDTVWCPGCMDREQRATLLADYAQLRADLLALRDEMLKASDAAGRAYDVSVEPKELERYAAEEEVTKQWAARLDQLLDRSSQTEVGAADASLFTPEELRLIGSILCDVADDAAEDADADKRAEAPLIRAVSRKAWDAGMAELKRVADASRREQE